MERLRLQKKTSYASEKLLPVRVPLHQRHVRAWPGLREDVSCCCWHLWITGSQCSLRSVQGTATTAEVALNSPAAATVWQLRLGLSAAICESDGDTVHSAELPREAIGDKCAEQERPQH